MVAAVCDRRTPTNRRLRAAAMNRAASMMFTAAVITAVITAVFFMAAVPPVAIASTSAGEDTPGGCQHRDRANDQQDYFHRPNPSSFGGRLPWGITPP